MTPLLGALSPAGARARLSVLIFHRVLAQPDPLFPDELDAQRFDAVCGWLKRWFNVLPLADAVRRLADGRLPSRAAAITFDDGYLDNHDLALPILQCHGLSATVFIATGFIGNGCMWNDLVIDALRRCDAGSIDFSGIDGLDPVVIPLGSIGDRRAAVAKAIAGLKYLPAARRGASVAALRERARVEPMPSLMMGVDQIRALRAAGITIGAHTVSHPILARTEPELARQEMDDSRRHLESILNERIGLFAYPNGRPDTDYSRVHAEIARDLGFDAAFTTAWGAARAGDDLHQLPRFTPWDRARIPFGLRLVRNVANPSPALAQ